MKIASTSNITNSRPAFKGTFVIPKGKNDSNQVSKAVFWLDGTVNRMDRAADVKIYPSNRFYKPNKVKIGNDDPLNELFATQLIKNGCNFSYKA